MNRATIKVYGRVQGVFFRHTARLHAEKLGLVGFARNEADGSVTTVAEGEEKSLEEFLAWCQKGPPLASVKNVNVEWRESTGAFKRFEIL